MIIDGRKIAEQLQLTIKDDIKKSVQNGQQRAPCLAVILVGAHSASTIYVARKAQACAVVGITLIRRDLSSDISLENLLSEISALNENDAVDGIIVQLPLPPHINPLHITHAISPTKDVDGFHPYNVGCMLLGETGGFLPCTPMGVMHLLREIKLDLTGKHAVVLGRSNIVGKPMAALLMQPAWGGNATVTIANRHTINLRALCQSADLLVVAVGQPHLITADMVKEGAVVIDVGVNKIVDHSKKEGYRIVGDVEFSSVASKCAHITPVPGGVGPMTIAMLLKNTLTSYQQKFSQI